LNRKCSVTSRQDRQAIFLGATEPRAARPERSYREGDASRPRRGGGVNELVKYGDIPESYIDSAYEQHCLGPPNSGRSYTCRAHAARACSRSWMSPSLGSILGEQG